MRRICAITVQSEVPIVSKAAEVPVETPVTRSYVPEEMLWQCTTCGACEYQCPVGIQHLPIIIGLRRGLVNTGKWEDEYGEKLFLSSKSTEILLASPASERDKFIAKNTLPLFDGSQEYCLWLGCMGAYDPGRPRHHTVAHPRAQSPRRDLGSAEEGAMHGRPGHAGSATTCWYPNLAEFNADATEAGEEVLTICPHCVRTMIEDWKEFGVEVGVEHHSAFLARHISFTAAAPDARKGSLSRSLLSRPLSRTCTMHRAKSSGRDRRSTATPRRARLLLRRRRRPDVSRRGRGANG